MLKVEKVKFNDRDLDKWLAGKVGIGRVLKVGFFAGAKYPDGRSVAAVAYKNETGAGGNPRRPFMHRTLKEHGEKWCRGIIKNLNGAYNTAAIDRAFNLAGMQARKDMVAMIKSWPPGDPRLNSQFTIRMKERRARKGKGLVPINPRTALIDTGQMVQSVSYEVTE